MVEGTNRQSSFVRASPKPHPPMETTKNSTATNTMSSLPQVGNDDSSEASSDGVIEVWVEPRKPLADAVDDNDHDDDDDEVIVVDADDVDVDSPSTTQTASTICTGNTSSRKNALAKSNHNDTSDHSLSSSAATGSCTSSRLCPPPVQHQRPRPIMNPTKQQQHQKLRPPQAPSPTNPIAANFQVRDPPGRLATPYQPKRPAHPGTTVLSQKPSPPNGPSSQWASAQANSIQLAQMGRPSLNSMASKAPPSSAHSSFQEAAASLPTQGSTSRVQKQFTSRSSDVPLRYPPLSSSSNGVSTIPDDSDEVALEHSALQVPTSSSGEGRLSERQAKRARSEDVAKGPAPYSKVYPYKYRSDSERQKETNARFRKTRVEQISQWKFPGKNKDDLHSLIHQSLRHGQDAPIVEVRHFPHNKKRRIKSATTKEEEDQNKKKKPYVTNVEYDARFFQWDSTPLGTIDILVRRPFIFAGKENPKPLLKPLPDSLPPSSSAPEIGILCQARIPHCHKGSSPPKDELLPGFDTLWDPVLADAAEKRGEDIKGFLNLKQQLSQKEVLMELLHKSSYSVAAAKKEYNRLKATSGDVPTNKFTVGEITKLSRLIDKCGKDFSTIATKMKRSRCDCMVNYYCWKRKDKKSYLELKKRWKSDFCAICDDGGEMLVCDGCEHAYHAECLDPPLKKVPQGDWFCPYCEDKRVASGKKTLGKTALQGIGVHSPGRQVSSPMVFPRHASPSKGIVFPRFRPPHTTDDKRSMSTGEESKSQSSGDCQRISGLREVYQASSKAQSATTVIPRTFYRPPSAWITSNHAAHISPYPLSAHNPPSTWTTSNHATHVSSYPLSAQNPPSTWTTSNHATHISSYPLSAQRYLASRGLVDVQAPSVYSAPNPFPLKSSSGVNDQGRQRSTDVRAPRLANNPLQSVSMPPRVAPHKPLHPATMNGRGSTKSPVNPGAPVVPPASQRNANAQSKSRVSKDEEVFELVTI